ncbi:MAG: hypothetical protein HY579_12495 [Nitrospinae bacterium]|nr:hypothetical protein [Nitrospinota bacterium]MBI5427925.1 hypothetical protein [Nitrospinota bacterium]
MGSFKYYLGRSLQIAGLGTLTAVVILFFTQMSMGTLLTWSLIGAVEFYGGTWLLDGQ